VVAGKCSIACVGTRIDPNSNDSALLETMLRDLRVPYLGVVPAARIYSRCLEQGLSVFDFPSDVAQGQMPHWAGVLAWLEALLARAPRVTADPRGVAQRPAMPPRTTLAASLIRNIPRFLVR
jgi:chromosome partitioning protein